MTKLKWEDSLKLDQFNPSLGTLNSVSLTLFGDVQGSAAGESSSLAAEEFTLNLVAALTITRPDGSTLVLSPTDSRTFAATAGDGNIDFGGTSGITYPDIGKSVSDTATFTDVAALAPYQGTGTVSLLVSAKGASNGDGPGDFDTKFVTNAGARASVTYDYTPAVIAVLPVSPVPEPGGYALMLAGLACIGAVARRRSGRR